MGRVLNIADFWIASDTGQAARPAGAQLYRFPAPAAATPDRVEGDEAEDRRQGRRMLFFLHVAAAVFVYSTWFLWHLHR